MSYLLVIVACLALFWVFKNFKKLMQGLFNKKPEKGGADEDFDRNNN